jgi:hypothetical protein
MIRILFLEDDFMLACYQRTAQKSPVVAPGLSLENRAKNKSPGTMTGAFVHWAFRDTPSSFRASSIFAQSGPV